MSDYAEPLAWRYRPSLGDQGAECQVLAGILVAEVAMEAVVPLDVQWEEWLRHRCACRRLTHQDDAVVLHLGDPLAFGAA